jgi:hypothetical protein
MWPRAGWGATGPRRFGPPSGALGRTWVALGGNVQYVTNPPPLKTFPNYTNPLPERPRNPFVMFLSSLLPPVLHIFYDLSRYGPFWWNSHHAYTGARFWRLRLPRNNLLLQVISTIFDHFPDSPPELRFAVVFIEFIQTNDDVKTPSKSTGVQNDTQTILFHLKLALYPFGGSPLALQDLRLATLGQFWGAPIQLMPPKGSSGSFWGRFGRRFHQPTRIWSLRKVYD